MILWRHLAFSAGARVALALAGAAALLLVGDLAEMAPHLARHPKGWGLAFELYRYKLPGLVFQALPLAVLFGLLLTVADLARSRELDALRAAGAGPFFVAAPLLSLTALLVAVAIAAGVNLVPNAQRTATRISVGALGRYTYTWTVFHKRRRWYATPEGVLYHIGQIDQGGERLHDLSRFEFGSGRFVSHGAAQTGHFDGEQWLLEDAATWRFGPDDETTVALGPFPLEVAPETFGGVLGQPEELNGRDLDAAIALRERQGRSTLRLELERHNRTAMPSLAFAMALLALGLSLGRSPPRTTVLAAGLGIGVAFGAWALLALFQALGMAGLVAPLHAAWAPVLLLGGAGALRIALLT